MARNGVFSRLWRPERMDEADCLNSSSSSSISSSGSSNSTTCDSQEVHVLAVDDSLVDRKVIEKLLKITSCKVTAVDSGRRALQFLGLDEEKKNSVGFNGLKVDLIITDYCMPGMTGFELLKKIKGSSAFRQVPVVIMSSENILARIDSCLEEGAEDFIVKPVKLADVKRLKDYMFGAEDHHHHHYRHRNSPKEETTGISKRKLQETSNDDDDVNVVLPKSSSSATVAATTTTATTTPSPPSSCSSSPPSSPKSFSSSSSEPSADLTPPTSPTTILDSPTGRLKMSSSSSSNCD